LALPANLSAARKVQLVCCYILQGFHFTMLNFVLDGSIAIGCINATGIQHNQEEHNQEHKGQ